MHFSFLLLHFFFFFLYIEVENVHGNLSCSYKVLGVPKMSVTEVIAKWLIVALVIVTNPSDRIILLQEAYNLAFMILLKYSSFEAFNNSTAFCVLCQIPFSCFDCLSADSLDSYQTQCSLQFLAFASVYRILTSYKALNLPYHRHIPKTFVFLFSQYLCSSNFFFISVAAWTPPSPSS